jgi:hypothetical protein
VEAAERKEGFEMKRTFATAIVACFFILVGAAPALACGGLVNPNGTVTLLRTTTLAGYRYGVEHYITSFKFKGGGAKFGSIVPLPGVPSKVRRAGDWTLQRLVREVRPQPEAVSADSGGAPNAARRAKVIFETEIDSLKIQIVKGGGRAVGRWAKKQGFSLTPDAPEVLQFYAKRSPIFMAVRFDPKDAKKSKKRKGDGVPIHLNIRTDDPWVPLRILGLGQSKDTVVKADVFLLTKREPAILPEPEPAGSEEGMILERSEAASRSLLRDLRSDKGGMQWVHKSKMWLTYLKLKVPAEDLIYDLATNVHGGEPSVEDTGTDTSDEPSGSPQQAALWNWAAASMFGLGAIALTNKVLSRRV